ncbi:MAG TPA: hypothetical protein VM073_11450 [Usitatibacter sp.]|nr:hypothetical protein [Usitatibacter sp.]
MAAIDHADLWRFDRHDRGVLILLVVLPLLIAAPQLLGYFKAEPVLYLGEMSRDFVRGVARGVPYIDPNNGLSTQALGALAAWQWLQGVVPWWNPYTGIGLPLGAEYQAGIFFPPTMLLLLDNGMVWYQVVLEVLAGLGTYGLLRQLGLGRTAATCGAIVYAFNGTLAWFAHAPAAPVPFLPWMLWGIERARVCAAAQRPSGWRLLAAGMAFSLLAPFPETAYLSGLFALGWALVRGFTLPRAAWAGYARRIAAGGLVGIAIALPQVVPFLQFLPLAEIGDHGDRFAHEALGPLSILPTLVTPYFFGPIFASVEGRPWLYGLWGGMGGYTTLALVAAAAYGFMARRNSLAWFLLAWVLLAVGRSFGFPGLSHLWNLVPAVSITAFYRYATPAWTLALVILAAYGVEALASTPAARPAARRAALAVVAAGVAAIAWISMPLWGEIFGSVRLRTWGVGSSVLAVGVALAVLRRLWRPGPRSATALAVILAVEASVMFAIPTLSNPRGGTPDLEAVRFLRENLGLQRFYTVGPIQANYGAFYRVASINYNYLPNSRQWYLWVRTNLDPRAHSVVFNGVRSGQPTATEVLRRNRQMYEQVGVKYVVAYAGGDPLEGTAKRVYSSSVMDIYELPDAKPYFEAPAGGCMLTEAVREGVVAECAAPVRLIRRELFFPGWSATVNGQDTTVREALDLYQSVDLPAGRSIVRFRYAPPHIEWSYLASALALAALAARRRRPPRRFAEFPAERP